MTSTDNDSNTQADNQADGETSPRHSAIDALLKRLLQEPVYPTPALRRTGRYFVLLGQEMVRNTLDDPELAAALRKLLEGRDAWLRAINLSIAPYYAGAGFHFHHEFDFPTALAELHAGNSVARVGWHGEGWLTLVPGSTITVDPDRPLGKAAPRLVGNQAAYSPHIDIVSHQGSTTTITPWHASQADILGNDWYTVGNGDIS